MTTDQVIPGRFLLLPSGRVVEVLGLLKDGVCECMYLHTRDYCELRVDWVRRHCRPYAVNARGAA